MTFVIMTFVVRKKQKQRFILNFIRLASGDLVNLTFGSESRNNIN